MRQGGTPAIGRARALRRRATEAERLLWRHLRNRRLGGHKFRRQHPCGRYVLDFYCLERKLAVELDGGGHGFPARRARDLKRDAFLRAQGIKVVRVWNSQLREDIEGVLSKIRKALG